MVLSLDPLRLSLASLLRNVTSTRLRERGNLFRIGRSFPLSQIASIVLNIGISTYMNYIVHPKEKYRCFDMELSNFNALACPANYSGDEFQLKNV
jgi:hypothetical protein